MFQYETDTIAAIATADGAGAIGAVRISGSDSEEILSRIFFSKSKNKAWESHKLRHGRIVYGGAAVDEVLAAVMRAPRTYTGEDAAEIFTHGGTAAVRGVFAAVIGSGARPAEPGEFTRRAFLNGRIDLAQAEAVAATIAAKTELACRAGVKQLGGGLSKRIEYYRSEILRLAANIELSIDYPEHESEAMNLREIRERCAPVRKEIEALAATYSTGKIITEGVRVAIVGRPNTGKSTMLNAILREDRAIVTEIAGTTRDVLTESVNVRGAPVFLSDTAGIRETSDAIEKIGVEKSLGAIENAELALWVCDSTLPPNGDDYKMAEALRNKKTIMLLNKSDLPESGGWNESELPVMFQRFIKISAKTGEGLNLLYDEIEAELLNGIDLNNAETEIITNERHKILLGGAAAQLWEAESAAARGFAEDLVSLHLTSAFGSLGEILGLGAGEELIDIIFSEFCVGK